MAPAFSARASGIHCEVMNSPFVIDFFNVGCGESMGGEKPRKRVKVTRLRPAPGGAVYSGGGGKRAGLLGHGVVAGIREGAETGTAAEFTAGFASLIAGGRSDSRTAATPAGR